jgi:hypothetical protein
MFVVRFRGQLYGLTCKHVFREFEPNTVFITDEKQARKGSKPAPVKTLCYPSSPKDGAVGTDVDDICVIEFKKVARRISSEAQNKTSTKEASPQAK